MMQEIGVDSCGIEIMAPKSMHYVIKLNPISSIGANILKQQMLSLGGDAATARDSLTGKIKKTPCLLMGTLSQLNRLNKKLRMQPFGLSQLAQGLALAMENYQKENFALELGKHKLYFGQRTHIMGILNLTPDSFSADGLYRGQSAVSGRRQINKIVDYAKKMVEDGADIIDVGGESTRPGARPVSLKEELARTIPVIRKLAKRIGAPISIDTYKPEVARQALDNGAVIVNDVTGLRDIQMRKIAGRYKAGVIILHMQGNPFSMQKNPGYDCIIEEIIGYFRKRLLAAEGAGIDRERIIIDPGIGFGKTVAHNLEILDRLQEFRVLGRPILVGTSRKSFIGKLLNVNPQERIYGTISSCVVAVKNGAKIVRVHDVKEVRQALKICDSINNVRYGK